MEHRTTRWRSEGWLCLGDHRRAVVSLGVALYLAGLAALGWAVLALHDRALDHRYHYLRAPTRLLPSALGTPAAPAVSLDVLRLLSQRASRATLR